LDNKVFEELKMFADDVVSKTSTQIKRPGRRTTEQSTRIDLCFHILY